MLENDVLSKHIDPEKLGVYGLSAGGYTAMGLIGAVPDVERMQTHCTQYTEEYVCSEGMVDAVMRAGMDSLPDNDWGADSRIKAAAIAAPAFGFAYTSETLANVSADIQFWSAGNDQSVPTDTNVTWLETQLPVKPETHRIAQANHFASMVVPCRDTFKAADPEEYEMVCGDAKGFDRREFHVQMHTEMIRFSNSSLIKALHAG